MTGPQVGGTALDQTEIADTGVVTSASMGSAATEDLGNRITDGWRSVVTRPMNNELAGSTTAADYVAYGSGNVAVAGTASGQGAFYLDPADYSQLATMRVRGTCLTNAVAPGQTFAYALKPCATFGGASAAYPTIATVSAAVASVTLTAPALSTQSQVVTAEFAPPTAGWYCLTITPGGTTTANANTVHGISLDVQG